MYSCFQSKLLHLKYPKNKGELSLGYRVKSLHKRKKGQLVLMPLFLAVGNYSNISVKYIILQQ